MNAIKVSVLCIGSALTATSGLLVATGIMPAKGVGFTVLLLAIGCIFGLISISWAVESAKLGRWKEAAGYLLLGACSIPAGVLGFIVGSWFSRVVTD